MTEDKDYIMLLLPTDDDKYIIAKAVVDTDKDIETLENAIIELPEQDGKKPNLKYPIVLVEDIETLREKLIEDIKNIKREDSDFVGYDDGTIECDIVIKIINRRFENDMS